MDDKRALNQGEASTLDTREQELLRARALVRTYIPEEANLSDELIAERREEAASEFSES